jgi:tuberous sclerosis protein 2
MIPISQPTAAPTPFLRTLSSLLSRDHATNLNPLLSATLLSIADHLTDSDTARLPLVMAEQHDLSPTSPDWLNNWESLFRSPSLVTGQRPKTRRAVMLALGSVYESVRDMTGYRRPLADLVCEFCERSRERAHDGGDGDGDGDGDVDGDDSDAMWRILGDEVVLRSVEGLEEGGDDTITRYIDLLVAVASEGGGEEDDDADAASIATTDTHSTSPQPTVIPILSRMQPDFHGRGRGDDGGSALPSVMSLITSLATGNSSRSQSMQPQTLDGHLESSASPPRPETTSLPRVVGAASTLVAIFSQLSFTPFVLEESNLSLAVRVYNILVNLVGEAKSVKAKLTILQFLMRLRADRDHRLYFVDSAYDPDGHITMLASLINRVWDGSLQRIERRVEEPFSDAVFDRMARSRMPQERDGRRTSRGRGGGPSNSAPSRSRSRVAAKSTPVTPAFQSRDPIWHIPQRLPFTIAQVDMPSEALISYDATAPGTRMVVPISTYLSAIVTILEKERNWEILSYVLCHLPVQLANKHLFCGPRSRDLVAKILTVLCTSILNCELGSCIDHWPVGLKARDARGLAYHTLSVLVSYRRCFDANQRHLLVEVFQAGLNEQLSTIKCCLHALSLSAFELQSSMTKCLPRILEKLSQIMSNPDMAVHILGFLSIIGSLRPLHANFTEGDFKMVFGVALQYLQHHNRISASPTVSWALSQHVRVLSYYVVYVWFLAVRLPDRPRHVRYITRQLLLANEGNEEVDEPTEVCFDWLARYAYASADPRPANSILSDIVMNPMVHGASPEIPISEKTWILGNSIVTIRTLTRLGWIEVLTRRPSGFTRFLCRVENAPMVGPGDVDPDTLSGPASLMMERDLPKVQVSYPADTADSHADCETPQAS